MARVWVLETEPHIQKVLTYTLTQWQKKGQKKRTEANTDNEINEENQQQKRIYALHRTVENDNDSLYAHVLHFGECFEFFGSVRFEFPFVPTMIQPVSLCRYTNYVILALCNVCLFFVSVCAKIDCLQRHMNVSVGTFSSLIYPSALTHRIVICKMTHLYHQRNTNKFHR